MISSYSLYGFWAETRERFAEVYRAPSPRAAEDLAQMGANEKGGTLIVARLVAGEVAPVDNYTLFVDPYDPQNLDVEGLEMAMDDLEGDPEWTVFGVAIPAGGRPFDIQRGERYGDVINATNALAAEDVARDRLKDKDGELLVCTVLAGRVAACDTYAAFVNPDMKVG
jgi:hypothetical protein